MTSELLATPVEKKIKERPHRFFPSTGGDRRWTNMKHKISIGILDRRILIFRVILHFYPKFYKREET